MHEKLAQTLLFHVIVAPTCLPQLTCLAIQGKGRDAERGGKPELGLWMDWIGLLGANSKRMKWIADASQSLSMVIFKKGFERKVFPVG